MARPGGYLPVLNSDHSQVRHHQRQVPVFVTAHHGQLDTHLSLGVGSQQLFSVVVYVHLSRFLFPFVLHFLSSCCVPCVWLFLLCRFVSPSS